MDRGKFLTERRIAKGLSQAQVADLLGYSPQSVSQWEKNKGVPDLSIFSKYANILGVDLDGFINLIDQKISDYGDSHSFSLQEFSNNLKILRKKNNFILKDVAKQVGANVKTVSSWEKGLSLPTLNNFLALCSFYKLSYEELYFAYLIPDNKKRKSLHKKRIFFPIILPIILSITTAGAVVTSIALSLNKHKHVPGEAVKENVVEPTCLENGHYDLVTYCVDDGEELSRYHTYVDELGHDYIKINETEATYDSDGIATYRCSRCSDTYTEVISHRLNHHYSDTYEHDENNHWRNCIDDGYNDLYTDYSSHSFSVETIQPTYEKDGLNTYTCIICGYSYSETIAQKIHQYSDEWSSDDKYHYHSCIDEGYEDLYIDKEKHDYIEEVDGYNVTLTCQTCGKIVEFERQYGVLNIYDENEDGILPLGDFEDIYISIYNKNSVPITSAGLIFRNLNINQELNYPSVFTTSHLIDEDISHNKLRLLASFFNNIWYKKEMDLELEIYTINDEEITPYCHTFKIVDL